MERNGNLLLVILAVFSVFFFSLSGAAPAFSTLPEIEISSVAIPEGDFYLPGFEVNLTTRSRDRGTFNVWLDDQYMEGVSQDGLAKPRKYVIYGYGHRVVSVIWVAEATRNTCYYSESLEVGDFDVGVDGIYHMPDGFVRVDLKLYSFKADFYNGQQSYVIFNNGQVFQSAAVQGRRGEYYIELTLSPEDYDKLLNLASVQVQLDNWRYTSGVKEIDISP